MPTRPKEFSFQSFNSILASAELKPVIVGGQAVNLWANIFLPTSPELNELAPFTSGDGDVLGDADLLVKLAKSKGFDYKLSPKNSASPVVGFLTAKSASGEELLVEVLTSVRGLSPNESKQTVDVELDGHVFRTLSPILLLKAKISNSLELPQAERQDIKHVRILAICVKRYILEACEFWLQNKLEDKDLLAILASAQSVVTTPAAISLSKAESIDFSLCFPPILESSNSERIRNFWKHQIPRIKKLLAA